MSDEMKTLIRALPSTATSIPGVQADHRSWPGKRGSGCRVVLRERDRPGAANIGSIDPTVRYALDVGFHVVVEGILYAGHYGEAEMRGWRHRGPDGRRGVQPMLVSSGRGCAAQESEEGSDVVNEQVGLFHRSGADGRVACP
ncbi:hypothetical protein [Streptomyces sp. NPDC017958]|uniref:hypothetical protein n=1 Tax=Streptomyces sp. NPDC017958 TaxID=3365021 RepID=UPI00378CEDEB